MRSDSEDRRALGSPSGPEQDEESQANDKEESYDNGGDSSSQELDCVGCGLSSKDRCPVEKKRNKHTKVRIKWGKSTKRKYKTSAGKTVTLVRVCGSWCRLCLNIARTWAKTKRYRCSKPDPSNPSKKKKDSAMKHIEHDLRLPDVKARFRANWKEAVHVKSGGRSRINNYKTVIKHHVGKTEKFQVATADFWLLSEFKKEFGDPAKYKLKVKTRKIKGQWKKRCLRP